MINLYIARHGQTEENLQRILQGQMPGHLTREGIEQAEELRDKLSGIHFDYIVTSDLKRAVDTTQIISEPHGGKFDQDTLLRERDFGIHTGGPYIKISRALDPSAETMDQVADRATAFLRKMQEEHDGEQILAVSHGLFLRVLQGVFFHQDTHEIEKMENAEVRILHLESNMTFETSAQKEIGGSAN